ncbi:transcriptional regulator [Pseudomonas cichorii]|uniref:TetR/AcrR family transcriptional regulator n=1 Tax=Pseudomonas cichorii TaxID=36746 RepID=UPI00190FDF90|nr:TetR/AcrR family transcriptional regulator [Pseudomonas cichorii]GFM81137.1 transcriptional regulator [Pseudomonas cichorii]
MRVRTEAKRQAILEAASQVFLESGFEGASMSQIAARVGGSKRTLYGYFANKEDLFVAVAHNVAEGLLGSLFDSLATTDEPLPVALARVGYSLSRLMTDEQTLQIMRTMIAVSGRSDIGVMFYATGPAKGLQALADYLERQMEAGTLRRSDSMITAQHFHSLHQAETLLPGLLGVLKNPTSQYLGESTVRALGAFLNAYAVLDHPLSNEQLIQAVKRASHAEQEKPRIAPGP